MATGFRTLIATRPGEQDHPCVRCAIAAARAPVITGTPLGAHASTPDNRESLTRYGLSQGEPEDDELDNKWISEKQFRDVSTDR